jgi:hypothetical protein
MEKYNIVTEMWRTRMNKVKQVKLQYVYFASYPVIQALTIFVEFIPILCSADTFL